jgi:hypothetical protein
MPERVVVIVRVIDERLVGEEVEVLESAHFTSRALLHELSGAR